MLEFCPIFRRLVGSCGVSFRKLPTLFILLHLARRFLNQNWIFFCSSLGNLFLGKTSLLSLLVVVVGPVGELVEGLGIAGHHGVAGVAVRLEPLLQLGHLDGRRGEEPNLLAPSPGFFFYILLLAPIPAPSPGSFSGSFSLLLLLALSPGSFPWHLRHRVDEGPVALFPLGQGLERGSEEGRLTTAAAAVALFLSHV